MKIFVDEFKKIILYLSNRHNVLTLKRTKKHGTSCNIMYIAVGKTYYPLMKSRKGCL